MSELRFSVILPLEDCRGEELECLRTWTQGQQFPRERYQVVLASAGAHPELEQKVARLLSPQDLLIRVPVRPHIESIHALVRAGGERAVGQVLVFSEIHCQADPTLLGALESYFASDERKCACVNSRGLNFNAVAEMENKHFDREFAEWRQAGRRRKILTRGFAVRREIYRATDGYQADLPFFADVELAAQLARLGHELGLIEQAWVTHTNTTDLATIRRNARIFARSEHRFRLKSRAIDLEEFIGVSEEWVGAMEDRRETAWNQASALMRSLRGNGLHCFLYLPMYARLLLNHVARAICGGRYRQGRLELKMLWARLQYHVPWLFAKERWRAFGEMWGLFIQQELVRLALTEKLPPGQQCLSSGWLPADQIHPACWVGAYDLEQVHGRSFRWTKPVCRFRFDLSAENAAETSELAIDTGGLRSPPAAQILGAFWNGARLPQGDIQESDNVLRLRLRGSRVGENELNLVCRVLQPSRQGEPDKRLLGLPVFAVDCRRTASARLAA